MILSLRKPEVQGHLGQVCQVERASGKFLKRKRATRFVLPLMFNNSRFLATGT